MFGCRAICISGFNNLLWKMFKHFVHFCGFRLISDAIKIVYVYFNYKMIDAECRTKMLCFLVKKQKKKYKLFTYRCQMRWVLTLLVGILLFFFVSYYVSVFSNNLRIESRHIRRRRSRCTGDRGFDLLSWKIFFCIGHIEYVCRGLNVCGCVLCVCACMCFRTPRYRRKSYRDCWVWDVYLFVYLCMSVFVKDFELLLSIG